MVSHPRIERPSMILLGMCHLLLMLRARPHNRITWGRRHGGKHFEGNFRERLIVTYGFVLRTVNHGRIPTQLKYSGFAGIARQEKAGEYYAINTLSAVSDDRVSGFHV